MTFQPRWLIPWWGSRTVWLDKTVQVEVED
jgi:hypothetical protein